MRLIQWSPRCKQSKTELCNASSCNLDEIICRPLHCHCSVLLKWPLIKSVKMFHRWNECIHAISFGLCFFHQHNVSLVYCSFFAPYDFSIFYRLHSIQFFALLILFFIHLIELSGKYFHKEIFAKYSSEWFRFFSPYFFCNSQCFEWINLLHAFGNVCLSLLLTVRWWRICYCCWVYKWKWTDDFPTVRQII